MPEYLKKLCDSDRQIASNFAAGRLETFGESTLQLLLKLFEDASAPQRF
jgi:hypothetical protein